MGASTLESGYRVELLLEAAEAEGARYALRLHRADGSELAQPVHTHRPVSLGDAGEDAYVDSLLRLVVKSHAADGRWPRKVRRWRADR